MKKLIPILVVLLSVAMLNNSNACTSIIVSGKVTADGRPLMWKHRDTNNDMNKLMYFMGEKYSYTGIVSLGKSELTDIWMGMNSAGFCIMNTASYNINDGEDSNEGYSEGRVMAMALSVCQTLEDFEEFLKGLEHPTGISANFGVIDAFGGVAFYEVGEHKLYKQDISDANIAPLGYMVKTNYSDNGNQLSGQGYARYITASDVFLNDAINGGISVKSILENAERNLVNGYTGDDLRELATSADKTRMVHFKDNIARRASTSSTIFKGVIPGEDPMSTVMWTVCGWPLATVAYPVWMNKDMVLPELLTAAKGTTSALCDAGLDIKQKALPITKGHGQDYLDINIIYNNDNTGVMQWIMPLEEKVFEITEKNTKSWGSRVPDLKQLQTLYMELDKLIIETYKNKGVSLK